MNDKNIQLREAALNTLGIYNNIINKKMIKIKRDKIIINKKINYYNNIILK